MTLFNIEVNMNEKELLQELYALNESERFYRSYQQAKKDPASFSRFLHSLDIRECVQKHILIPEFKETMPPSMRDEYFYSDTEAGMVVQKHNCYSPDFEHFHTYFEAFYVYDGTCDHALGGKKETMHIGDFCIIPPGVSHRISVQNQSIVIVMILSAQVIENTFRNPTFYKNNLLSEFFLKHLRFSSEDDSLVFHTGNDQDLRNILIQMMLESRNKYQEYDAILSAYFSLFFGKLLRHYEHTIDAPDQDSRRNAAAADIVAYIHEHHTDITLPQLAEKYHYTPEYTSRYIKEVTGRTFSQILIDARMKHAVSLLQSTGLPVSEVAYQVGYENTENFIRRFKKTYNKTPDRYRRELLMRLIR